MALSVVFMGGRQAGCIGLLTLEAADCTVRLAVAYDDQVRAVCGALGIPTARSIREESAVAALGTADLLVSVHGREIVPGALLAAPRRGGINVHPCLYLYPGADPIARLLREGNPRASVAVHRMTERMDAGEVLVERFVDVAGLTTVEAVYHALYPWYAVALLEALAAFNMARRAKGEEP